MKTRIYTTLERIEFGAATFLYLTGLASTLYEYNCQTDIDPGLIAFFQSDYGTGVLQFTAFYLAFLVLNFIAVPDMIKGISLTRAFICISVIVAGICLAFPNCWAWLLLLAMLAGYFVIRFGMIYALKVFRTLSGPLQYALSRIIIFSTVWIIFILLILLADDGAHFTVFLWGIAFPFAAGLYYYSKHRLIPKSYQKKRPLAYYVLRVLLILAFAHVTLMVVMLIFIEYPDDAMAAVALNNVFQLTFTVPLAWIFYKRRMADTLEMRSLKKEAGQSQAGLDFLRSQINPHFLFNALNTIYGTALQENAARTGEGVERLGNMMRFMLQENMQDTIPLSRETEYLSNYIDLQKLRIAEHPDITLKTDIPDNITSLYIAPMLLIPFVENAFKHGISFRAASYISVTLGIDGNSLQFDVHNSKHPKQYLDPEKGKSGIGLENVRQRLEILYPSRHTLTIHETNKEFFIHLTLEL